VVRAKLCFDEHRAPSSLESERITRELGDSLRRAYQDAIVETVPEQLRELLDRLD